MSPCRLTVFCALVFGSFAQYANSTVITDTAPPPGASSISNGWDLQFTYPKKDSAYRAGESLCVQCDGTYPVDTIVYELYCRGFFNRTINAAARKRQYYYWQIPNVLETDSEYTVKVSDPRDPALVTFSPKFTIQNVPEITLANPGAVVQGSNCTFTWSGIGTLGTLTLSFSADTGKSWTVISTSQNNIDRFLWIIPSFGNIFDAQVRIRSDNSAHTEDTVIFTMGAKPRLVSPIGTITNDYRVPFIWHSLGNVQTYTLSIDTTRDFKHPFVLLPLTDTVFTPVTTLPLDTIYWKVVPDGQQIFASTVASFVVLDNRIPVAIPVEPSIIIDHRPVLRWHPVAGAAVYRLMIAEHPAFNFTDLDTLLIDTSCTPANDLAEMTLYWKVKSDIFDQYCPVQSFTIQSAVVPLLCRFDSAAASSNTPVFRWNKTPGASSYAIQIFDSFDKSILSAATADTFFQMPTPLNPGYYKWRVSSSRDPSRFSSYDFVYIPFSTVIAALDATTRTPVYTATLGRDGVFIQYNLPREAVIDIRLYTVNGKLIAARRGVQPPGDGSWKLSAALPPGVYIFGISIGERHFTRRCSLLR